MRLKLTLSCKKGAALALNNRYELSAVLYSIIEKSDGNFSAWLHNKGYTADGRNFKLFTFGWLDAYPYEKKGKDVHISKEGKVTWEVSFCVDKIIEHFVAGIFQNQTFELKAGFQEKVVFRVENVEILKMPNVATTMLYNCITPILIGEKQEGSRNEQYLSPLDEGFERLFLHNLRGKVKAVQGDAFVDSDDVSFRLLSPAEQIKRKPFEVYKDKEKLRYIPYSFNFELSVPLDWQKIGYLAGFGQDNAQGLGMVRQGVK
jgi:CRISPR-associated endoribonuclease Cas6